jgi:hypothetical protein
MLNNRRRLACLLPIVMLILQGCVAAAAPLMYATSAAVVGYSGYSIYNSAAGGSFEVAFEGEKPGQDVLKQMAQMRRPAVWPTPGSVGAVVFADTLESLGDYRPHPPSKVSEILAARRISVDLSMLTSRERTAAFGSVCKALGADGVVAYASKGHSVDSSFLGGFRVRGKASVEIFYHSCTQDRLVFSETLAILQEAGTSGSSDQIMFHAAGEVLAKRFDGLARGQAQFMTVAQR